MQNKHFFQNFGIITEKDLFTSAFFSEKGCEFMKKLVAGFGRSALPDDDFSPRTLPVTRKDLARMGIPARKIPRLMRELQRAADARPELEDRIALLHLARALSAVLP